MTFQPNQKKLLIALYANAAMLLFVALALFARSSSGPLISAANAQNQLPIGGGAGVFIVPAQFSTNTYGVYLMDIDAQTLMSYQFYPSDKQLRFTAARNFRYDRKLSNFNTTPPPNEIRELLEKEIENARTNDAVKSANPEPQDKDK